MKNNLLILICTLFTLSSFDTFAKGLGNGSAGTTSVSGVINSYAAVSSFDNTKQSVTLFTVDTASFFQKHDLALVIQMQGVSVDVTNTSNYGTVLNFNNTGRYEYVRVDSIAGSVIYTTKVHNNYDTGAVIQLVRVPQYNTVTISTVLQGMPWNGKKGGVIAVDAVDSIILNAAISAKGIGFRGGIPRVDNLSSVKDTNYRSLSGLNGMKGEGIAGRGEIAQQMIYGRGAIANGGGGGNNHNAGGGGGANMGCGGFGGWGTYNSVLHPDARGIGGASLLSVADSGHIAFMGGGGGAGQVNDNFLSIPGNGGGIVILSANVIAGNAQTIDANGTDAADNNGYDGASGAGAGGSVLLFGDYIHQLTVLCNGGKGANPTKFFNQHLVAPGGGGGGGLINVKAGAIDTGNIYEVKNGISGICDTSYYGATDGCNGIYMKMLNVIAPANPPTTGIAGTVSVEALTFSYMPNPATDNIEISIQGNTQGKNRLSVYDMAGREYVSMDFEGSHQKINVATLPAGIYVLRLSNGHSVSTGKMVKH